MSDHKPNESNISKTLEEVQLMASFNIYEPVTSHRRLLGPFIIFFRRVIRRLTRWYVLSLAGQQERFNNAILQAIHNLDTKVSALELRCNSRIDSLDILQESLKEHESRINSFDLLRESLKVHESRIDSLGKLSESLSDNEMRINSILDKFHNESVYLSSRIRRMERKQPLHFEEAEDKHYLSKKPAVNSEDYDFDYLTFEHMFRGTEKEIKERQSIYLEYFVHKQNVLDIGCGRGEFLELLSDNGIKAKGIDINGDSIAICEDKCLDVECVDALEYLSTVSDGSLGGVMLAQVVEHLDMPYLIELLNLIYAKMEKSACIILESPNPRTLAIYRNSFYLDPGHVKPIHPDLLKFITTSIGFREVQEKTYAYSKDGYDLPFIRGEGITNVDEFNSGIGVLNNILFGNQDYSIIAFK